MAFISLVIALLLEQARPFNPNGPPYSWFNLYAENIVHNYNGGQRHHGVVGWCLAVLPWVVVTEVIFLLIYLVHPWLAWLWNVAVLYVAMGFRQFSHGFTALLEALRAGQLEQARTLLSEWRNEPAEEYTHNEIAKVAIEHGLVSAHRYVFGVIAWFVLLPAVAGTLLPGYLGVLLSGPGGAVLYRLSTMLYERWSVTRSDLREFGRFARDVFRVLDWLPARLTALSFAIVGDFEDAVYCWRSQAASWMNPHQGVVLASGAGAIGVRLGETLHQRGAVTFRPELGLGEEAELEHMQSAVGLIWRAVILWVLAIGLLSLITLL